MDSQLSELVSRRQSADTLQHVYRLRWVRNTLIIMKFDSLTLSNIHTCIFKLQNVLYTSTYTPKRLIKPFQYGTALPKGQGKTFFAFLMFFLVTCNTNCTRWEILNHLLVLTC